MQAVLAIVVTMTGIAAVVGLSTLAAQWVLRRCMPEYGAGPWWGLSVWMAFVMGVLAPLGVGGIIGFMVLGRHIAGFN